MGVSEALRIEQCKKAPGRVRVYRGWQTTQLCGDYNKPFKQSLWSNRDSMENNSFFFSWLNCCYVVSYVPESINSLYDTDGHPTFNDGNPEKMGIKTPTFGLMTIPSIIENDRCFFSWLNWFLWSCKSWGKLSYFLPDALQGPSSLVYVETGLPQGYGDEGDGDRKS